MAEPLSPGASQPNNPGPRAPITPPSPESPPSPQSPSSPWNARIPGGESKICSTPVLVVVLSASVLMTLVVVVVFALSVDSGRLQRTTVRSNASCCFRQAMALYRQLDFAAHPCRHFYSHVCSNFQEDPDLPNIKAFEYNLDSDFYMKPARAAGLAVYNLFQSCLADTKNAHSLGGPTAATYIEVLGGKELARTKTPRELLAFLFVMTVKYGISVNPAIAVYGRGGFPDFLYFEGMSTIGEFLVIALKEPRPHVQAVLTEKYGRLRRECLNSINQLLNISVTLQAMEDIEREIDLNYTTTYVMSNSSIVAGLLPSLTLEDWEVVVRNVSGGDLPPKLYHANVMATQHTLSVLFDVTRQPATLAFFIFKAVSDVLLGHLKYSSLYRSKSVFRMCRQVVSRHPALSVAAALEQNEEDQEREDAFRQMFAEIVGAILVKAAAILPPQDQRNVSSYLTSLRVLFPTEVYPVQSVPHLSRDYARNLITLFTSGWEFYSYKLPPGITRRISSAALSYGVFVINRNVVIPLVVYSGLRSNGSADDVVGMSAIGVLIADAIWSDILLNRVWSAAATEMVRHYGSCQKNLGTFLPDRFFLFKLPIITISTAQEVARTPQWLEEFPVTELWKSSKCRLFYYMFVRHHYCPVTQGTKKQIAEEVQYITSLSKDFLSAFQCPPPKTPPPTCSMAAIP